MAQGLSWLLALEGFMFLSDRISVDRPFELSVAVWGPLDSITHGLVAAAVVLPGAWRRGSAVRAWALLATLAAMTLDLDHFVAAGSLSLYDATHLSMRPGAHSFVVAAAGGGLLGLGSRNLGLVFALAIGSHVLRDAIMGGTPMFWPLGGPTAVPTWLYHAAMPLFGVLSYVGFGPRTPGWVQELDRRIRRRGAP